MVVVSRMATRGSTRTRPTSGRSATAATPSTPSRPRVCRVCGEHHSHHEPHLYNYEGEVDEDLMCQICLQPFVQPVDTPCSHTFCHACLHNYLKVNPMCPLDRKPVNEMTISPSNLVLKRLLDKLLVRCPNGDSCDEVLQRGHLDDHLRYRCSGTLVACQYASAGCTHRAPAKSMPKHQDECLFKKEGITRLPVLEGEVSHVEIPRTDPNLGITIVGGADTPLRCVVIQECYPDGLITQDGRLQPGDQIIEVNGVDMTCATHSQVCASLRKMSSVLRLGVYRERIERYSKSSVSTTTTSITHSELAPKAETKNGHSSNGHSDSSEDLVNVTLQRRANAPLGIRLSDRCGENGVYIVELEPDAHITQLAHMDRILFVNGQDVRNASVARCSQLIASSSSVNLVVARVRPRRSTDPTGTADTSDNVASPKDSLAISHSRSKSAPAIHNECLYTHVRKPLDDDNDDEEHCIRRRMRSGASAQNDEADEKTNLRRHSNGGLGPDPVYDVPEGHEDYMAIYETLDRVVRKKPSVKTSHSMEALETPTPSLKSFEFPDPASNMTANAQPSPQIPSAAKRRELEDDQRHLHEEVEEQEEDVEARVLSHVMRSSLRKALRLDSTHMLQRVVMVKKNARESLGMRIGGGIGSNEGDTPIYIANIHPHGCIGKCKQIKKGDLLLSMDTTSLCGLTHTQAVTTLKSAVDKMHVTLCVMDGPESCSGASNFIPSWMFWQKLPRCLHFPKTVILHRRETASWGFSIVGGLDVAAPTRNVERKKKNEKEETMKKSCLNEPIHVLFVVPGSPASKDAKLKCGDRLLAVDGHSLENIPHSLAVAMLKRTSTRVVLEVVSWMGTEI